MCPLYYNHHDGIIICHKRGQVRRIQLDGTVLYQYEESGEAGLTVDAQGNVYVSDQVENEIHRLLPDGRFCDIF